MSTVTVAYEDKTTTFTVNVLAEGDVPTLTVANVTTTNNKTVRVPIVMKNNPGIIVMRVNVTYDNQYLTLTGIEDGGLLGTQQHRPVDDKVPYILYWNNSTAPQNITENGAIATLVFEVSDNVPVGNYNISLSYNSNGDIFNYDLSDVFFQTEAGAVNVIDILYGDVNNDGYVNPIDVTILARSLADWTDIQIDKPATDLNCDWYINAMDLTILVRYLAEWQGYEELPIIQSLASPIATTLFSLLSVNDPNIIVSNATGDVGDTVDVTIDLQNNPGIISMRLLAEFDNNVLQLVGVTNGTVLGQLTSTPLASVDDSIRLYWQDTGYSSNLTGNGTIVTLRFKILTKTLDTPISVSYSNENGDTDIYNFNLSLISFEISNGSVSTIPVCTHNYTSEITTEATCTAQGYATYTCDCGDSYVGDTNALGHSWGDGVVTAQPTYSMEGVRTYTCSLCGETRTENILRLTGGGGGGDRLPSGSTVEEVEIEEVDTPMADIPFDNPFDDVLSDKWYYDDVMCAYTNELMRGMADDKFNPDGNLTRAMIVTILWRLEGSPELEETLMLESFADVVQGEYYELAIAWASKNEIVFGYVDVSFGPDDDVTREQLAAILWRYAKYKKVDVLSDEDMDILSYNDAFDISEYAISAMQWACAKGIITGKPGGILDPQGGATRAETAAMLYRFVDATKEVQP
ncbi:MAG: S-layer homology domain-containing protein [Bacteroidaceae bacterium]|nr:S-layer homology domain-containing protein [Bacteroidaceae bacterium]